MGRIESLLRGELARLARKETKLLQSHWVEEVRRLKKRVSDLQRQVACLEKSRAVAISASRMIEARQSVTTDDLQKTRLSPLLIRKLRKRMGISQPQLAVLLDVSPAAVGFWEVGKSQPRPEMKARIVALRKLGRRDIKRLLAERSEGRTASGTGKK